MVAILRSLPQKQLLRALKDGGPDVHTAFTAHMGKFDHIPQRYLDALEKTRPVRLSLVLLTHRCLHARARPPHHPVLSCPSLISKYLRLFVVPVLTWRRRLRRQQQLRPHLLQRHPPQLLTRAPKRRAALQRQARQLQRRIASRRRMTAMMTTTTTE
jgi:hypothetical protein